MRRVNATTDIEALLHRSDVAFAIPAHLGCPGGTGSRGGTSTARRVARHSGGGLMYDLAGENGLDLDALRARLRRMSERELLSFGRAARYMCSPTANLAKPPRQVFVIQLREAAKEWGRRRRTPHNGVTLGV